MRSGRGFAICRQSGRHARDSLAWPHQEVCGSVVVGASVRDRIFYPFAVLAVVLILYLAIRPGFVKTGTDLETILRDGLIVSGNDLKTLALAPGTVAEFSKDANGQTIAVLSTNIARNMVSPSAGVFVILGPRFKKAFAGRKLRLTLRARSSSIDPLNSFDMAYFALGGGRTGWKRFTLTDRFEDYILTFRPAVVTDGPNTDYFGVWPGQDGNNAKMDVQSFRIEVIPQKGN